MLERDIADIEKNVSALEAKTEAQEKRLDSLEKSKESDARIVTELRTMVQQHNEFTKRSMETFEKVNDNLSSLNASQEMQKHVQEVTNKETIKSFEGFRVDIQQVHSRITDIEEQNKKSVINMGELTREIIFKVAPAVALAWLMLKFGL